MASSRIHVIYEYGIDMRPHSSSYIRLIRPLTHPSLANNLEITFSPRPPNVSVDVVIVDRLWRPDIKSETAKQLVDDIHAMVARLVYTLDDNILDLPWVRSDWPQERHLQVLRVFLQAADQVWVTIQALEQRLSELNQSILVIPNALDERLLCHRGPTMAKSLFDPQRIIIGMMGTQTHDQDLIMVAPALHELWQRHPDKFELEIVGLVDREDTLEILSGLPFKVNNPPSEEQEYPLFQLWFSSSVNWDIALAPLSDNPFTRCKSDIKFLDYSAIGAAGIYSHVPAYSSNIQHMETGFLVENQIETWVNALEEYINNEPLRLSISRSARRLLYSKRTLEKLSHNWSEALLKVI